MSSTSQEKFSIPSFELTDKVVLVTGSSKGIGRAIATAAAGHGARVVITGRDLISVKKTASEILEATGADVLPLALDVQHRESCQSVIDETVAHFGRLDALVNNAGTDHIGPATDYAPEDWDDILLTNLSGYWHCAQIAGNQMIKQGHGGSIVMTSSVSGLLGIKGLAGYAAAKGGVNGIVKTLAVEWAEYGIRVNAIGPGYVDNIMETAGAEHARPEKQKQIMDFTPMRRRAKVAELGGPTVFLMSDAASYVTGQILMVDGGYSSN